MFKKFGFAVLLAGMLFGVTSNANAALLIVPGNPSNLPGNYDPTPPVPGVAAGFAGQIGAMLGLDKWSVLKIEYLGKEASFNNRFLFDTDNNGLTSADVQFSTDSTAPGSSFMAFLDTAATYQSILPLAFGHNSTNPTVLNILRALATSPNVFMAVDPNNPNAVLIFLDDSGAGPDVDFDDMIIRITVVSEIPEPGSIALVGMALLLIGGFFAYRRRQRGWGSAA
jgi:hypothetical protein